MPASIRLSVLIPLIFSTALCLPLDAQAVLADDDFALESGWVAASGDWSISPEGNLIQRDRDETMAQITRPVWQEGLVMYQFEITIDGGLEDGYGGAGIHIAVNDPSRVRSWGNGRSYLLWLTYDREAYGGESFFGQLYESTDQVTMHMLHNGARFPVGLGNPPSLVGRSMSVTIVINTETGLGIFRDPFLKDYVYSFSLPAPVQAGAFVSLRTNSLAVTIDNFRVIKLPS